MAPALTCLNLFDASPDFVTIAPLSGRPVFANRTFRLAMGVSVDEPIESLLEFRPPGFADFVFHVIVPHIRAHGSWTGDTEYVSHQGDVVQVSQISVLERDAASGTELLATIGRLDAASRGDVQRLQEAADRTRFALEAAKAGVWEEDIRTGNVYWSETMRIVQGFRDERFDGSRDSFLALVHPEDRPSVEASMASVAQHPRDFELQFRVLWPDGSVHWIESRGRVITDTNGEPRTVLGVAQDVTERKTLEGQLRQAQKLEAIGQLAGGLAHDFNNLLTAILGYAGLVEASLEEGDPRLADLREVEKAGARAAHLTTQLLAFSRTQVLKPVVLSLNDQIEDVARILSRLAGDMVRLRTHLTPDLQSTKADPNQLEQVLVNLVVNARDAMPDGGTLDLRTENLAVDQNLARSLDVPEGDYVVLKVIDTGTGMDDATLQRIFEPFFTTKAAGKGTGLGLATVFGIVRQSGGTIRVDSVVGKGTTFTLYFPAVGHGAEHQRAAAADAPRGGSERLLLVEDEAVVREWAKVVLERLGYDVMAAATPGDALGLLRDVPGFDLVISDVALPEMSGPAMGRMISERYPGAPILYISGASTDWLAHHGIGNDDVPFLQKPFTCRDLSARVRDILDARPTAAMVCVSEQVPA